MPRVSKHSLSPNQLGQLSQQLSSLISSLKNKNRIENFIEEFLTVEEKNMLAKRLALFMMLKQSFSSSHIQTVLNLSRETVRIYEHHFPLKSKVFHETISHLLKQQNIKDFFNKTEKVLTTILTAKTNMKSRAKIMSGKWI